MFAVNGRASMSNEHDGLVEKKVLLTLSDMMTVWHSSPCFIILLSEQSYAFLSVLVWSRWHGCSAVITKRSFRVAKINTLVE